MEEDSDRDCLLFFAAGGGSFNLICQVDMITRLFSITSNIPCGKHLIKMVVLIFELVCSYYPDKPS